MGTKGKDELKMSEKYWVLNKNRHAFVLHPLSVHVLKSPKHSTMLQFCEFIIFASRLHCEEAVAKPVFTAKSFFRCSIRDA